MNGRTIAIGDIHGFSAALDALLGAVCPAADDTLVLLGDYVDRGPDTRGVLRRMIELSGQCRLVPLLGNHDHLFVEICEGRDDLRGDWLLYGGDATVASYGRVPHDVPPEHLNLLRALPLYYETPTHFFVHASYDPRLPLDQQPAPLALWQSLRARLPGPHYSGKIAVVGHTAQKNGQVFDLGYLKCIDTWCYGDGWLTALDVGAGQLWQADKHGRLRT
jgi:serine/threonine protein phosphatase 1